MDAQGMSLTKITLLLITLLFSIAASALDTTEAAGYCVADENYLEQLSSLSDKSYDLSIDFSCLTSLHSLSNPLPTYQVVDTRTAIDSSERISEAWQIDAQKLRSMPVLANRQLLLIGGAFSRVEAAKTCASLKNNGFSNVKVLVDGASAWRTHHQPRYLNARDGTASISPRELIYEYFNGRVILAPASQRVADQLTELGLSDDQYIVGPRAATLQEVVADHSNGGYYPVVFVNDEQHSPTSSMDRFTNLYLLEGGVNAIAKELLKSRWINARRESAPRRHYCG